MAIAAREGRRARLLDLLLHQLPAHAPPREGVGRRLPRRRPRDRRRAHAGVRLRARARTTSAARCATSASTYPVALDPDYGTWQAWDNRYWPAKYFVDRARPHPLRPLRRGRLRGERGGDPRAARRGRRRALGLRRDRRRDADRAADARELSRATSGSTASSARSIEPDREAEYTIPKFVPLHGLAYGGRWTVEDERIVAGEDARLRLHFIGSNVFLVLGTEGEQRDRASVTLDGTTRRHGRR